MKKIALLLTVRLAAIIILVSYFSISQANALEKDAIPKDPNPKKYKKHMLLNQTDSTKLFQSKPLLSDSTKVKAKPAASYNILFQVIYRKSLSAIFEESN